MTTHNTAPEMTDGQRNEIIETFIGAIPSLNFFQAKEVINDKRPFVNGIGVAFEPYLVSKPTAVSALQCAIPADGEEFELTIEATDPMEMLRNDGYDPSGWRFIGSQVASQTSRFKLMRVGPCQSLSQVRKKISQHGFIPEGQWRGAFKRAFQNSDSKVTIGIADPSWVDPNSYLRFPVLNKLEKTWVSFFHHANFFYNECWRWLVESKSSR